MYFNDLKKIYMFFHDLKRKTTSISSFSSLSSRPIARYSRIPEQKPHRTGCFLHRCIGRDAGGSCSAQLGCQEATTRGRFATASLPHFLSICPCFLRPVRCYFHYLYYMLIIFILIIITITVVITLFS